MATPPMISWVRLEFDELRLAAATDWRPDWTDGRPVARRPEWLTLGPLFGAGLLGAELFDPALCDPPPPLGAEPPPFVVVTRLAAAELLAAIGRDLFDGRLATGILLCWSADPTVRPAV